MFSKYHEAVFLVIPGRWSGDLNLYVIFLHWRISTISCSPSVFISFFNAILISPITCVLPGKAEKTTLINVRGNQTYLSNLERSKILWGFFLFCFGFCLLVFVLFCFSLLTLDLVLICLGFFPYNSYSYTCIS